MNRPYTDITTAKPNNPLKNGTIIGLATPQGSYSKYNFYTQNTPTINNINNKYGNKFYNGLFVQLSDNQTIIGA